MTSVNLKSLRLNEARLSTARLCTLKLYNGLCTLRTRLSLSTDTGHRLGIRVVPAESDAHGSFYWSFLPLDIRHHRASCACDVYVRWKEAAQVLKFCRWTRYEINADLRISQRTTTLSAICLRGHVSVHILHACLRIYARVDFSKMYFGYDVTPGLNSAWSKFKWADRAMRTSGRCGQHNPTDILLCHFENGYDPRGYIRVASSWIAEGASMLHEYCQTRWVTL